MSLLVSSWISLINMPLLGHDCPFMTKDLRKAIMLRAKLRNKFNKDITTLANLAYKRQRNLCTSPVKKAKREYYGNLNPAVISDNKKFWRTVKPNSRIK